MYEKKNVHIPAICALAAALLVADLSAGTQQAPKPMPSVEQGDKITRFRFYNNIGRTVEVKWHDRQGRATLAHGNPVASGASWGVWDDGGSTWSMNWFGIYVDGKLFCNFRPGKAAEFDLTNTEPNQYCTMKPRRRVLQFNVSSSSFFAIGSEFEGRMGVHPEKIEVMIDHATIVHRDNSRYKGPREVQWLTANLAKSTGDGWTRAIRSERFPIGEVLELDEQMTVGDISFSLPREEQMDLSEYWLVFTIGEHDGDGTVGTSHAQSQRDIFSSR